MPFFKVRFVRNVTQQDEFFRYIEAKDEKQAQSVAADLAGQADADRPDDATDTNVEICHEWEVDEFDEVSDVADQYIVIKATDHENPRAD